MLKRTNKLKILAALLLSMFFLTVIFQSDFTNYQYSEDDNDYSINFDDDAKRADTRPDVVYFCNGSIDSWNDAKADGWVSSGDGSYSNPYIIANLVIDGENMKHGIRIENWGYNKFSYRIENCTFINIGTSNVLFPKAGIYLENVNYEWMTHGKGVIQNNTFDTNFDLDNYGIYLYRSGNATISNNAFTDFKNGIYFDNASNSCIVSENYFTDNQNGIFLDDRCNEINITENTFRDNFIAGIYVLEGFTLLISDNIIEESTNFGLILSDCEGGGWDPWVFKMRSPINIKENIIRKNKYGLFIDSSFEHQIKENNITENSNEGIWIFLSEFNNITNNIIRNNTLRGINLEDSMNNRVYNNFFMENGEHAIDKTSLNNFSINKIGNFWDNYTGDDIDDDGIGDAWHNFTGNRDEYPFFNDGIDAGYDRANYIIWINATHPQYNWTWAKGRFWFSGGTGNSIDPYVISPNNLWNGTVNGSGRKACINILDASNINIWYRIEGLTLFGAEVGILLNDTAEGMYTTYGHIANNNISFNGNGIILDASIDNNITGNIINNNTNMGIYIYNNSNINNIWENEIAGNKYGAFIEKNSHENNFTQNIFLQNSDYGAYIKSGIYSCNFSGFWNNRFQGNNINAWDDGPPLATQPQWASKWSIGMLGNYWADYTGKDGDDDGIGDNGIDPFTPEPYYIGGTASNQDDYPIWDDGYEGTSLYINGGATGVGAHNWTWASNRLFITGNGSANNPYLIKDLSFNGTDSESAIFIENTDNVYFRIENCTLTDIGDTDSNEAGIKLDRVSDGEIIGNRFSTDNTGNYGIYAKQSNQTIIDGNDISSNEVFDAGIYIENYSTSIIIRNNEINQNKWGIFINSYSDNINITGNNIESNELSGIYLRNCSYIRIKYNNINSNLGNGTLLVHSGYLNEIVSNNIQNNGEFGVIVNRSSIQTTRVYNNTFSGNADNAWDDGTWTEWYTILGANLGNSWSDYVSNVEGRGFTAEDKDDNGIGDVNYTIRGSANGTDKYPIFQDQFDGGRIYIDGDLPVSQEIDGVWVLTWNDAKDKFWCTGSGTRKNPYVIKNIDIDAMGRNSSIHIQDYPTGMVSAYFRIENCRVFNTSTENDTAGISLYNTKNGVLLNNNCSANGYAGIQVIGSHNITINNNTIEDNEYYGISSRNWCQNLFISNNDLKDNGLNSGGEGSGIYVQNPSINPTIFNNTLEGDNVGINLRNADNLNISENIIKSSVLHGIATTDWCNNLTIAGNDIYLCGEDGINFGWTFVSPAFYCDIIDNNIHDNTKYGILLDLLESSEIVGNTIDNNLKGIVVNAKCEDNLFFNNRILNNQEDGMLFKMGTGGNIIYFNNFTGNLVSAADFGLDPVSPNIWYKASAQLGNYWDDYTGKDANDDGIGDDPNDYLIPGGLGISEDIYPIWRDGPVFLISFKNDKPLGSYNFTENDPPNFQYRFSEGESHYVWYEIDGTKSIPVKLVPPGKNGTIDDKFDGEVSLNIWLSLTEIQFVITFYANDSQGEVGFLSYNIRLVNYTGGPILPPSDDDDDDGDDAEAGIFGTEEEGGLPWWLQAIFTGIISASAGLILKISYSAHKKRKELYRKISDNLDRVDNIEKFLQDNLGLEDWAKLKDSLEKYKNHEISSKELVKQSKKSVGKRFLHLFIKPKKRKK